MESFIADHPAVVILIMGILFSLVTFFVRNKVNNIDKKAKTNCANIKKNGEEIKEVKENYLERFDDVKESINELKLMVTEVHSDVKSQAEFCKYIQEHKK